MLLAAASIGLAGAHVARKPLPPAPVPIVTPSAEGDEWPADDLAALQTDLDGLLDGAAAIRGAHAGVFALETRTGNVLYARRPDELFQVASTLKLIVGSAALERLGPAYRWHTRAYWKVGGRRPQPPVLVLKAGGDPLLSGADLETLGPVLRAQRGRAVARRIDPSRYELQPHPPGWSWDDLTFDYAPPIAAIGLEENVAHAAPARGATEADDVAVRDPVAAAYADLGRVMRRAGLRTGAAAPRDFDPALRDPGARHGERYLGPIWEHRSASLGEILGPNFWIPSDNFVGEMLLRELGFVSAGKPGTTANGIAFEKRWLRALGIEPSSLTLADGSGLSQYDRATPRVLTAVLQHDWNGPNRDLVLASLPVGGARGTIEGITGTAAAGRVFAKTGSMMHVRGLAGFLATKRHGSVTFAFTVDDWNGDYAALAALRAAVLARIVTD